MNVAEVLQQPIPDLSAAREQKIGYRDYPLVEETARNKEPLVDIAEYGIAGQSYYSRKNAATGQAVAEVPAVVLVRRGIAERLAAINHALGESPEVTALLGGQVELYIEEGLRSRLMQARLYNDVFPRLIAQQHPEWDEAAIAARRDELISKPADNPADTPSPHATGAAIDLSLRFAQPHLGYVSDAGMKLDPQDAATGETNNPDYYEHMALKGRADQQIQRNRRVFYWVMRGALLGEDSGFVVNPTEWWHWSHGDQMWATLTQAPQAFYGFPPEHSSIS